MSRIKSLFQYKCPKCESGEVFSERKYLSLGKMNANCSKCQHKFEQEPGFFFGAMYVSYALTIAIAVAIYVISHLLFESLSIAEIVGVIALSFVVFAPINYKISRMVWMYIFTQKTI